MRFFGPTVVAVRLRQGWGTRILSASASVVGIGVPVAVLVIAGSGRGAGKTAVGCALIAAIPELRWVAVKISPHVHGLPLEAKATDCEGESTYGLKPVPFVQETSSITDSGLSEELDFRSDKDTGRYLAAGARRAFLISGVADSRLSERVAEVRSRASSCDGLVLESNRITAGMVAKLGERTVTVAVVAGPEDEWKVSLRECAGSLDALVLGHGLVQDEFAPVYRRKPVFGLSGGQWSVPELVRFVRGELIGGSV